jgi:hypothetical protein
MRNQLKETTIYKPNKFTTVTVNNKAFTLESTGEIAYEHTVTIKATGGISTSKLTFASTDDLAEYIGNIDVDELQQALPL